MAPNRDLLYRSVLCTLKAKPVKIAYIADMLGFATPVGTAVAVKLRTRLKQLEADGLALRTGECSLTRYTLAPSKLARSAKHTAKQASAPKPYTPRRDALRELCKVRGVPKLVIALKPARRRTVTQRVVGVSPALAQMLTLHMFKCAQRLPGAANRAPSYPGYLHPLDDCKHG